MNFAAAMAGNFVARGSRSFRRVATVTSWMFHPGTPVHSFTRLARSSVFAVSNGDQLSFVGAGHVTHPWMFPDLYPHDSLPVLRVLSGAHVRYTLDFPDVRPSQAHFGRFTPACMSFTAVRDPR